MLIVSATISLLLLIAGLAVIAGMIVPNVARIAVALRDLDGWSSRIAPLVSEPSMQLIRAPRVARSMLLAAA